MIMIVERFTVDLDSEISLIASHVDKYVLYSSENDDGEMTVEAANYLIKTKT